MTVEELIEELKAMPQTAMVEVQIRTNIGYDGTVLQFDDEDEWRDLKPLSVEYIYGRVRVRVEE